MQVIELNASRWMTAIDVLSALRTALGVPDRLGFAPEAFIDAMIEGGIRVQPPYEVRIVGSARASGEVRAYLVVLQIMLRSAREDKRARSGADAEVSVQTVEGAVR